MKRISKIEPTMKRKQKIWGDALKGLVPECQILWPLGGQFGGISKVKVVHSDYL